MTLAAGTRLGSYEIVSALGVGGMGEVYRAYDSKLNRHVALKVLPAAFTLDPDRLARFRREAQVLGSLNHPNIGAIYGLEESGDRPALVLELIEGPTLADRIAQGAMALEEALPIARQVAEALEAAHEQGVIHRDLKPSNIKLRPDGAVKVLDFGLAKAYEPAASNVTMSPTITTPAMTQLGMILGTAAYMSPEQAKGRPADKRSDVWAFGCVLYEMLSGKRAFEGEDVSDTLANVLKVDPDWHALPPEAPPAIRMLIQRCLAKDRRQRIADFSVVLFVLNDPANVRSPEIVPASGLAPPPTKPLWKRAMPVAAAVLLTAIVAGAAAWRLRQSPAAAPVARFTFALPDGQRFTQLARHNLAFSPDGTQLVYVANNNRLIVRALSAFDPHPIPGSDGSLPIATPAFSPDGRSIAFYFPNDGAIKRIAVSGGVAVTVCPATPAPLGLRWDSSGIVFGAGRDGILRCSPNGGAPERIVTVAEGEEAHGPQVLLDGAAVLFTVAKTADGATRWDKAQIVMQRIGSADRKILIAPGADGRYVPSGHLLYALGGVVFAVPFDPARQEVMGSAVPVIEGVRRSVGMAHFATSPTGTLSYIPGPVGLATNERTVALADRAGTVTRLPLPTGPYTHVRVSRDGGRLAIGSEDGREAIVSIHDLAGTTSVRRLTFGGRNRFPIWSPDGLRVAFQSDREGDPGIFSQRVDGIGPVERLTKAGPGETHVPESWSPDGKHISFAVLKGSMFSLSILTVEDKKATPFADVKSAEPIGSVFSPDGRWIAYAASLVSGGSGGAASLSRGVYVQPFPAATARYQAPKQQLDFHPVWGPKGAELFYVPTAASGRLAFVTVTTEPGISFGTPQSLPATVTASRISSEMRAHDILPDGRFVGLVGASESESSGPAAPPQIRVVVNWFEELKARVPR